MAARQIRRTVRRTIGAASLSAAIALLVPAAATAAQLSEGGVGGTSVVEESADTVTQTVATTTQAVTGDDATAAGPIDEVLDVVEETAAQLTRAVGDAGDDAPEPVGPVVSDGAETVGGAVDTATGGVRDVVGEPDDDGEGGTDAPSGPVPAIVGGDTPQRGAGTTTRPVAALPGGVSRGATFRSLTSVPTFSSGAAPAVAPSAVLRDPLVRTTDGEPMWAAPTTASAPTGPIAAVPGLPDGIATEIALAAALLVVATGALVAELGPERAGATA